MAENERELGWDDVITKDSDEYVLLPDGDYDFKVTKLERGRHNGSAKLPACNKAVLTISIDGEEQGNTTIIHNLFLHSKCEGMISNFFTSIGLKKPGEPLKMEWNKIINKTGRCRVYIDTWTNDRGEEKKSNKIKRFLTPETDPETAPTAPPSWANKQW